MRLNLPLLFQLVQKLGMHYYEDFDSKLHNPRGQCGTKLHFFKKGQKEHLELKVFLLLLPTLFLHEITVEISAWIWCCKYKKDSPIV
jgi:hypothetical protein